MPGEETVQESSDASGDEDAPRVSADEDAPWSSDESEVVADASGHEVARAVANALPREVVVCGTGDLADRVVEGADQRGFASAASPGAVDEATGALVVAIDGGESDGGVALADHAARLEGMVVAVLAVPDGGIEESTLTAVRETADAVVFVSPAGARRSRAIDGGDAVEASAGVDPAVEGALAFVRMIRAPGYVNMDLADAHTVLDEQPLGVFGCGVANGAPTGPVAAVADAFGRFPDAVRTAGATGALVTVGGPAGTTLADAIAAVRAVRERIDDDAHIIWGSTGKQARLSVRVILAGIDHEQRPSPGDPCPRCGSVLRSFALDGSETLTCEACGFADLSMSL